MGVSTKNVPSKRIDKDSVQDLLVPVSVASATSSVEPTPVVTDDQLKSQLELLNVLREPGYDFLYESIEYRRYITDPEKLFIIWLNLFTV